LQKAQATTNLSIVENSSSNADQISVRDRSTFVKDVHSQGERVVQ